MIKKTVLLIVLMAVIGLSGIAGAQTPRNMHKDDCKNGNEKGNIKGTCDDNKDKEDKECNNVLGHFAPSGYRQGGEKGKCDDKKDDDENNCINTGVAQTQVLQNRRVCGHL